MVSIQWFSESISEFDVPLCKDYLLQGGVVNETTTVRQVVESKTGLLLVGDLFKGLVFSNKKQFSQLKQALELYVSEPSEAAVLIIRANKNGYISVGASWEFETDYQWVVEDNSWFFRTSYTEVVDRSANPFTRKSEAPTSQSPTRTKKTKEN